MNKLELKIPKLTDTGDFDTKIVYKYRNFEKSLSEYLLFATHLPTDYFAKVTDLAIFYDDELINLPENIAANLLAYLIGFYKAYNISSNFTCHHFSSLLKTGKSLELYQYNFHSSTYPHLFSGDIVYFITQTGEFGSSLKMEVIHSAVFLGKGLFFSKNGKCLPVICTLEAMLKTYPCDYINAATDITVINNFINLDLSMHISFKNKTYVQNGLGFRALNTVCNGFRQVIREEIAASYRYACLRFHPDKTILQKDQAALFFDITKKIYNFFMDPIQRSEYNVSLLAGNDWSIARILNLFGDNSSTVKTYFEAFVTLLNFYKKLTPEEERKIKSDPIYKNALATTETYYDTNLIMHISSDIARSYNQDSYHPTSISFEGKTQNVQENPFFQITSNTRINDLKIYWGTPVKICLNKDEFNEQSMDSQEFLEKLPPGLITYSDIKLALKLLKLWLTRDNTEIYVNIDSNKKILINWQPNSLVLFGGTRTFRVYNSAIYLGGNFYLYSSNPLSNEVYIVNQAFIQQNNILKNIFPVERGNNLDAQENVQQLMKCSNLNATDAESFPLFSLDQTKWFKWYLLNFQSLKENDFISYLNGFNLKKGQLNYNYNPFIIQTAIFPGDSILLCKNNRVINTAFHLGNYLFAFIDSNSHLRIVNLLMLSESANWDRLFIMQKINNMPEGNYFCEIFQYRTKIPFLNINQPLLYGILEIPFDLTNLSAINEQIIIECYNKRLLNESDSNIINVLNLAYKLLMNDFYRVFYGTEILFGKEPELTVSILLNITDTKLPTDIVKEYLACLKLINNHSLKERISKEFQFISAKKSLTINFINLLPSNPNLSYTMNSYFTGCYRWQLREQTYEIFTPERILSQFPDARETFVKLEQQFELKEISLSELPPSSINKLFEYIWRSTSSDKNDLTLMLNFSSRLSLSECSKTYNFQWFSDNPFRFFKPQNINKDIRFTLSGRPNVLYEIQSISEISDDILRFYRFEHDFKLEQCIRIKEDENYFILVYSSEKLALLAQFKDQPSQYPKHELKGFNKLYPS